MKTLILTFLLCITPLISKAQEPQLQWAKSIGGVSNEDGHSIAVDALGNLYTIGSFRGTVDFDPSPGIFNLSATGTHDIFISKFDPLGSFVWTKQIYGTAVHANYSIVLDPFGNMYVTGNYQTTVDFDPNEGIYNLTSTDGGEDDMFFLKLDSEGNFIWAKTIGGLSKYESTQAIAADKLGNVYVTGSFEGRTDFDPGDSTFYLSSAGLEDIFILKLDRLGNLVWAKQIGGKADDYGNSIVIDESGNLYTTGYFSRSSDFDPGQGTFFLTPNGIDDVFILRLDSSGNFVWAKQIGGSKYDIGKSIAIASSGNLFITGYFEEKVDFNPGKDTSYLTSIVNDDVFILKLDNSGNFIWAKRIGDTSDINATNIIVDASENVYLAGYFQGTLDFDPSINTLNLTSIGKDDIFILKLDGLGNLIWTKKIGSPELDYGSSMATDIYGDLYCVSGFSETINCGTSINTFNLTSAGGRDILFMKLTQTPEDVYQTSEFPSSLNIYPNPTNSTVTVNFGKQITNGTIKLTNMMGQIVIQQSEINSTSVNLDIDHLAKDLYFIEVVGNGNTTRMKFIKD